MKTTIYNSAKDQWAGHVGNLDGNSTGDWRYVPVLDYTVGTIQAVLASGTWAAAVLTVERSNNGTNWAGIVPSAVTIGAGGGMTVTIDCSAYAFLRVVVTTPEGAASSIQLIGCFKGDG